jgi:hypothetical protein
MNPNVYTSTPIQGALSVPRQPTNLYNSPTPIPTTKIQTVIIILVIGVVTALILNIRRKKKGKPVTVQSSQPKKPSTMDEVKKAVKTIFISSIMDEKELERFLRTQTAEQINSLHDPSVIFCSPLHICCQNGQINLVKLLLDKDKTKDSLVQLNRSKQTPLMAICHRLFRLPTNFENFNQIINLLLNEMSREQINCMNDRQETALSMLVNGYNLLAEKNCGKTYFLLTVKSLIDHGAQPTPNLKELLDDGSNILTRKQKNQISKHLQQKRGGEGGGGGGGGGGS